MKLLVLPYAVNGRGDIPKCSLQFASVVFLMQDCLFKFFILRNFMLFQVLCFIRKLFDFSAALSWHEPTPLVFKLVFIEGLKIFQNFWGRACALEGPNLFGEVDLFLDGTTLMAN